MAKKKVLDIPTLSKDTLKVFDVINNESELAVVLIGSNYVDQCLAGRLKSMYRPRLFGQTFDHQAAVSKL